MMETLLAGTILVVTLALVLVRPGGLNRAWWPVFGGGVVVITGLVPPDQVIGVLSETADPLVLLVGLMLLSAVAEKAGFFDWSASLAVRAGGGRVARLFALVFLIGCLITALLSLDATAVVLTPIVYGTVSRLRLKPMPFMFACVYAANTASLFLPISNLTNLLAYNAFDLGFAQYALIMLAPAALAVLTNLLLFGWLFRRDIRGSYDPMVSRFSPESPAFFRTTTGSIVVVLAAFFLAPLAGVPIGLMALVGGALVVGAAVTFGWVRIREVAGSVSWDVLALVMGFFLVVRATEGTGLGTLVDAIYDAAAPGDGFPQILMMVFATALGSNILNNLPMTLVSLNALEPLVSNGGIESSAVYATVIGTGVGPNLTVVGSLATLIWLSIVRGKGVEVTAKDYLKVGAVSTPPILFSGALGLWLSLQLFGL